MRTRAHGHHADLLGVEATLLGLAADEADGALFSGDTVFAQGYGRYDLAGGSLHQLLGSLRLILSLDRSLRVYPGHGESAALAQIARYFGK